MQEDKERVEGMLPASLERLAQASGWDSAMEFAWRYGGRRLFVPRFPRLDWPASEVVGLAGASALADLFGGEAMEVPLAHKALSRWLSGRGWSQDDIAHELRVNRGTVCRWLSGRRHAGAFRRDGSTRTHGEGVVWGGG